MKRIITSAKSSNNTFCKYLNLNAQLSKTLRTKTGLGGHPGVTGRWFKKTLIVGKVTHSLYNKNNVCLYL